MKIEIARSIDNGKWYGKIDDEVVTKNQKWLWQCLTKIMKYAKAQGV